MAARKPKLLLVREAEATGKVHEIFEEYKRKLSLPQVSLIYKAYAAYPQFLELHWQAFEPLLETREFFDLAARLRAEAYTRAHNYFHIPDLCAMIDRLSFSPGARRELTQLVELLHIANPPILLMAAAQLEAFDRKVGEERKTRTAPALPRFEKPVLVEEAMAPAGTRKIYDDMRRALELPLLNMDYRALGRWPDFLKNYWETLSAIVETPVYRESREGVAETALQLAKEIPRPIELTVEKLQDSGLSDEHVAELVRMTQMFVKMFSGLVLNMAVAKIGLDGGSNAVSSKAEPQRVPA